MTAHREPPPNNIRGRVIGLPANYHMSMTTPSRRGRPSHDDLLTPAEWRIVHAVKHGMTSRKIAAHRGISIDAVKFHVANALAKLGLTNRKALRQWHQTPKDSALQQKGKAMNVRMTLGPIGQILRSVRDIKTSQTSGTASESVLYLRVTDIAAAHHELRSRGVELSNAPHMIHRHADGTEEWMAFFRDPEGRTLAITAQAVK